MKRRLDGVIDIDVDDLWPRDEQHRYRLYAVHGHARDILGATDAQSLGGMILTIHRDLKKAGRSLSDLGMIGILDAVEGEWVVLPYTRRQEDVTFGPKPRVIKEK